MAWIKIPVENHPLFHAALPRDPKVSTIQMFGGVAGLVNGNLFSGLFARSALVKLGEADHAEAMKLDGAEPFDPMGRGHVMSNTVLLPETIMDEPEELRAWIRKAFDYAVTLPPKKKKPKGKARAAKPAKTPVAARAAKPTHARSPAKTTRTTGSAKTGATKFVTARATRIAKARATTPANMAHATKLAKARRSAKAAKTGRGAPSPTKRSARARSKRSGR
jgi:TfoX/Sxy family transcriptional regulator of competence genes